MRAFLFAVRLRSLYLWRGSVPADPIQAHGLQWVAFQTVAGHDSKASATYSCSLGWEGPNGPFPMACWHRPRRTLPAAQFDSIVAAGTAEAALARESEARALSEAASLRREAITAWKQLEERQQALQALEVGMDADATP